LKKLCWNCLKFVLLLIIIISLSMTIYMDCKGSAFDPIRGIQKLSSDNRRDDALDLARFFRENQTEDQDKFAKIEKALEYTTTEKIKSFVWNGIVKGEVYDNYSGLGAIYRSPVAHMKSVLLSAVTITSSYGTISLREGLCKRLVLTPA